MPFLREDSMIFLYFVQVTVDIGQFSEVIRSFHRLLDLKNKYSDTQVRRNPRVLGKLIENN